MQSAICDEQKFIFLLPQKSDEEFLWGLMLIREP